MTADDVSEENAETQALGDEVAANHLEVTLDRILHAPTAAEMRDMVDEAKQRGDLDSPHAAEQTPASETPPR